MLPIVVYKNIINYYREKMKKKRKDCKSCKGKKAFLFLVLALGVVTFFVGQTKERRVVTRITVLHKNSQKNSVNTKQKKISIKSHPSKKIVIKSHSSKKICIRNFSKRK